MMEAGDPLESEGITILIADDSATSRILLRSALLRWGYRVILAENGYQAWEIMSRPDAPQIAILDWVMPGPTGPELCRKIRELPIDDYRYLILLTSKNTKDETIQGLEAGADDYIVKPFDEHELQVRIRAGVRVTAAIRGSRPTLRPIEFYSCFISYATADEEISEKLNRDLNQLGIKTWYGPEDLRIGDEFRLRIDESIRIHDKLLLILSEASLNSEWVKAEVESALDQETVRKRGEPELQGNTTVLFPIRIDDAILKAREGWAALVKRTRHIGNFSGWRNPPDYASALNRLVRDLRATEKRDRIAEENRRKRSE